MRYRPLGQTGMHVSVHCLGNMMRKLDAVEQLDALARAADCTLPQLVIAFTLAHPAVTSTILGPRTMEQPHQPARHGRPRPRGRPPRPHRRDHTARHRPLPEWSWRPPALTDPALRRRRQGIGASVVAVPSAARAA